MKGPRRAQRPVAERGVLAGPGPPAARIQPPDAHGPASGRRASAKGRTAPPPALQPADGPWRAAFRCCCRCGCGCPQCFKHRKTILLHGPNKNRARERSGLKATLSKPWPTALKKLLKKRTSGRRKQAHGYQRGWGRGYRRGLGVT